MRTFLSLLYAIVITAIIFIIFNACSTFIASKTNILYIIIPLALALIGANKVMHALSKPFNTWFNIHTKAQRIIVSIPAWIMCLICLFFLIDICIEGVSFWKLGPTSLILVLVNAVSSCFVSVMWGLSPYRFSNALHKF